MSFWSKLAKIGLVAGGALAAPVSGGASLYGALAAAGGGALAGKGIGDRLMPGKSSSTVVGGPGHFDDAGTWLADQDPMLATQKDGSGINWGAVGKYAAPIGAGALQGYLSNRQANKSDQSHMALAESQLDPFRGYMHQAQDLSRLDLMDQDYTPPATQPDAKYGAGLNLAAPQSYGPSATTRAVLRSARDRIAGGSVAPTMTDSKNYGQLPVVSGVPAQASADVVPPDEIRRLLARVAARRSGGAQPMAV